MTPWDFIEYLLRFIDETKGKAANERVEMIKAEIVEYLEILEEEERERQKTWWGEKHD